MKKSLLNIAVAAGIALTPVSSVIAADVKADDAVWASFERAFGQYQGTPAALASAAQPHKVAFTGILTQNVWTYNLVSGIGSTLNT